MKNVINVDSNDLPKRIIKHASGFEAQVCRLGPQIGAKQLGCSVVDVPPGKKAWPKHAHSVNEEMFYILSGRGTLHYGEQQQEIKSGDLISCPANLKMAHQLENTGQEPLRYLALGTQIEPEICYYPNSDKFGIYDNRNNENENDIYMLMRAKDSLDYYDGE